ncbi:MFS transporter [Paenibacillus radicis (ex Gao et al. 2016)]|uniref:MFS-type transporter YkuC n=1 Tax=Paenibacillus radicis (ex Gao et al. 2016) TaxID=1737354 RepID=A0A917GZX4_9BACL|nr:MFS transporter [Paenibacillus radicis (ex Gao et al. 2016)]GGG63040.1 putative MFS-type transporter YkuC [Paenibacillus radicis (ex Gao et al. 2016)]
MIALFRNPIFSKLFAANFLSQLGTVVGNMAFAYYLVDRFSTRPSYATMAELMYSLPTLAVFWVVGVIADLINRKWIAVNSDWIRAGLTLLLLLFVHYDVIFMCFLILFLRSAVSKFFGPAEMGLLQGSIGPEQYVQASGLNQMITGVFLLFGMSLGATAYYYMGIEGAIIVDCLSFIGSGILLLLCQFPETALMPNGKKRLRDLRIPMLIKDFRQGLDYILKFKLLLMLVSGFLFFGIINGVFAVLPIFTMKYKLSPDNYIVHSSLITIFLGIGFLIGSIIGPLFIKRFSRANVLIAGLFMSSIIIIALGSMNAIWAYLPIVLLAGITIAPVNIALGSWMPELVTPQNIGKVNALIEPVMMLGHSLALGFVALAFPAFITITWLHYILGLCTIAVSTSYLIGLPPLLRVRVTAADETVNRPSS